MGVADFTGRGGEFEVAGLGVRSTPLEEAVVEIKTYSYSRGPTCRPKSRSIMGHFNGQSPLKYMRVVLSSL